MAIGGTSQLEMRLEDHRVELTGYCYRMLGSAFEAEDAVQDTMVRAWRGLDRFEGRSALRSWLYRIATNVCLDMLQGRQRRARPMGLAPPSSADAALGPPLPEATWILPAPDGRVLPAAGGPEERAIARESIRLAFIAALQNLPPRQRAVLILRDVLRWQAAEVAELLDSSVASVNSALQRARATLDDLHVESTDPAPPVDDAQAALLERYLDAFERYDVEALTALLAEDATQSMPPYELWLSGRDEILRWWLGPGRGLPRLAPDPHGGQRPPRVRPVPGQRPRRRPRAVGAAGDRDLRRPDRGLQLLPGHRQPLPPLPAAAHAGLTSAGRGAARSIAACARPRRHTA